MQNIETIISLIVACASAIVALITFIVKFVNAIKEKNKEKALKLLNDFACQAVKKAETIVSVSGETMTGESKKEYATKEIQFLLSQVGINFDVKTIWDKIEEIVALTKKVNGREKDQNKLEGVA